MAKVAFILSHAAEFNTNPGFLVNGVVAPAIRSHFPSVATDLYINSVWGSIAQRQSRTSVEPDQAVQAFMGGALRKMYSGLTSAITANRSVLIASNFRYIGQREKVLKHLVPAGYQVFGLEAYLPESEVINQPLSHNEGFLATSSFEMTSATEEVALDLSAMVQSYHQAVGGKRFPDQEDTL
jgi:hypothetical protein